jgi:1,4-alpha-glucan branching enzyme
MKTTTHRETISRANEKPVLVPVHFEYIDCDAESVCVAGTFNDWHPGSTPLAHFRSRGVWVKDLKLPVGTYQYNFIVDGHWKPDPTCREMVENPFGGLNSVVHVKKPHNAN